MDNEKAIVIKTFSNEINAKIVQLNLESMGIDSQINKEDCGGAYPQLQTTIGVKLLVAPGDVNNAKAIIKEIKAEEISNVKKSVRSTKFQGWGIFFIGIFIGVLFTVITFKVYKVDQQTLNGKVDYDNNTDGKPDMIYSYSRGKLIDIQEDRNYDGSPDLWHYYESGKLKRSELDDNFDGKVDGWIKYKDQYNYLSKFDCDFDGLPDVTYSIADGIKQRIDWHPNDSRVVSRREIFSDGVKREEYLDHNNDGKFDTQITFDPFSQKINQVNYQKKK